MSVAMRHRWQDGRSDSGDTLVEVLVAILILSAAGLALLTGFSTTISGSAQHRSLAANDLALRTAAEAAFSMIQQQASPLYTVCHDSTKYSNLAAQYNAEAQAITPNFGVTNSGYTASISVPPGSSIPAPVQFWTSSFTWSSTEPSDCTTPVPELVTMTVVNGNGTSESTQFVVNDINAALNPSSTVAVTSLTPNQVTQGATVTMTLTGRGFYSDAAVTFSNSNIQVNSISSCASATLPCTSLTMNISVPNSVNDSVPPGTYDVTVTNPKEGTSGTGEALLQVTPAAQVIGVVPSVLAVDGKESFTLYGNQFATGMSIAVNPVVGTIPLLVTNVVVTSSTTATMTIQGPGLVTGEGSYYFSVTLPGASSSTTTGSLLQVFPDPTISSSTPTCNPGFQGTANCVIYGANFQPGASVSIGIGTPSGTTAGVVNSYQVIGGSSTQLSTEIDFNVSGTSNVQGDTANIVVTNPDTTSATFIGGFHNG